MKIALIGYGKMGKLIEQLAIQQEDNVIVKYQKNHALTTMISDADVVIDFSQAEGQLNRLSYVMNLKKPLVIGTTGWEASLPEADAIVKAAQGSCLYSPNFSIGIFLFKKIIQNAATLIESFSDYDVSAIELHHKQKKDAPSGTAKELIKTVKSAMPRAESFTFESVRCGSIPGTHSLIFDSPVDTLTLTHEARSREGFAKGALIGSRWLLNKKGFFTMDDFIHDISLLTQN